MKVCSPVHRSNSHSVATTWVGDCGEPLVDRGLCCRCFGTGEPTHRVQSQVDLTVVLLGCPSSSSIRKKLAPGPASMGTAGSTHIQQQQQQHPLLHPVCLRCRLYTHQQASTVYPWASCENASHAPSQQPHVMPQTTLRCMPVVQPHTIHRCRRHAEPIQSFWSGDKFSSKEHLRTWQRPSCHLHCTLPHHHQLLRHNPLACQHLACWHKLHLHQLHRHR